ncbi:EF-P 5-aminopentanol modification-associated protein YfmH [Numidum massiliense]|uniref:EF-P 5-aminopentanol modification-associated protein YfmH n=1 Tax=Numidum massiliense TaxID=1522315 RepID=UPI0006D54E8A|nr:pitrilysin family protein [Numidum massiliense]
MEAITFDQLQETLYFEKLPNGLEVYVLPRKGFQKTYATFTTRYGSIDNDFQPPNGERTRVPDGIAHFLEHKMFEQEDGDVFNDFSEQGASANAYTSFERTAYLFSCTDRVPENLTTLINFVQDPYFTDENVEKEKGIIAQEIRMYDDNPDWRVYFGLIEAMFAAHPVRIDIAGTVESISKITKETLYACYETFYHPSNMLLFVVGAVDPEETMRLVRDNQAAKPYKDKGAIERFYPEEDAVVAEPLKEVQLSVGIPKCLMGFKETGVHVKGDEYLKREFATAIALEALFGQSSDLYQSLYDDGLIDQGFGFDYSLEEGYAFSMFGGDTNDPDALLNRVKEALAKPDALIIDTAQFERLKRKKIGEFLRQLNSPEFIANQFTRYRFNAADLFRVVPVLEQLTLEDVQARLADHVNAEQFCASVVRPVANDAATQ